MKKSHSLPFSLIRSFIRSPICRSCVFSFARLRHSFFEQFFWVIVFLMKSSQHLEHCNICIFYWLEVIISIIRFKVSSDWSNRSSEESYGISYSESTSSCQSYSQGDTYCTAIVSLFCHQSISLFSFIHLWKSDKMAV